MSSFPKYRRARGPMREGLVAAVVAAIVAVLAITAVVTIAAAEETTCHGPFCPLPRRLVPVRPHAQPGAVVPRRPHPAVVRIVNAAPDGRYHGSGTLIRKDARRGIVLTCAHLFRNGTGKVIVAFPDGRRFEAEVLAIDSRWDLAVLAIAPPPASPVAIAREPPRVGDPLTSCGYGPDGRYGCNQGYARGYVRAGGTSTRETLELSGTARGGDSGGPIFNARGQLVAVLWGTDGRTVGGTYCGRIRKFLEGVQGLLTPRREDAKEGKREREREEEEEEEEGTTEGTEDTEKEDGSGQGPGVSGREGDPRPPTPNPQLQELKERIGEQGRTLNTLGEKIARAAGVLADLQRAAADRPSPSSIINHPSSIPTAWYVGLLAALGWTGPPAVAVIVAARILIGWRRRRKGITPQSHGGHGGKEKEEGREEGREEGDHQSSIINHQSRRPLHDDYAKQLNSVFGLSGRSAVADATLGREYDEELRRAAASSDAALATWAKRLRDRVANKFYRIHEAAPSPAEPIEE